MRKRYPSVRHDLQAHPELRQQQAMLMSGQSNFTVTGTAAPIGGCGVGPWMYAAERAVLHVLQQVTAAVRTAQGATPGARVKPVYLRFLLSAALMAVANLSPVAAQSQQTEQQFIDSTMSAIAAFQASLPPAPNAKVVLSGNLVYANGAFYLQKAVPPLNVLLQYVEGMKAAGVQRVDLNPAVTSINNPAATAAYDALVTHARELGMQLALNPQVVGGELGSSPTFQDFENMAMTTYPALAARYQPDNFVIVHEPTTMNARLGVTATTQDWDGFIRAVAPLIKAASPHTRLGAGGFYETDENTYFEDFVTIPLLDFMTMDVYDDSNFTGYNAWVQLAHTAVDPTHPNGKGIYIEETWAPDYLPDTLPSDWQSNPAGLSAYTLVGECNADFAAMDTSWLQAMLMWASASGMEAVTAFTTEAFFYYYQGSTTEGTATYQYDSPLNPTYIGQALLAIHTGQLTTTAKAYLAFGQQSGIPQVTSLSSASYATLPSVFTPNCGPANNPCNAETVVAADELVTAYGADLANTTTSIDGNFPTNLGGTTATLLDSSNTSYTVPLFFVSPKQVSYYVPSNAALGPATLTVNSGDGSQTTGVVMVTHVMPGIYTADQNGQGPPSAIAIVIHADGSQSSQLTYSCSGAAGCTPAPISLVSTDALYIELFGTGIRHVAGLTAVSAAVNGQSASVKYAGPSGFTGEDQVNIQIPQNLFGSGAVSLALTVGGLPANTVTLDLE